MDVLFHGVRLGDVDWDLDVDVVGHWDLLGYGVGLWDWNLRKT